MTKTEGRTAEAPGSPRPENHGSGFGQKILGDLGTPAVRFFTSTVVAALVAVVGQLAGGGAAQAGTSGFRCPTTGRLVSAGHTTVEVRSKCREPCH